jgi:hypothetical protein
MNCEEAAHTEKKKMVQQNMNFMRTTVRKISTVEMSHSPVLQPLFAISTGYTTTTLYHF